MPAAQTARKEQARSPPNPARSVRRTRSSIRLCATAASSMLLPSESAEMYNQLLDSYMARYQPRDECERQVLLQIHYAMWRMRRIPTIETTLLYSEIMRINNTDEDEIGFKNMGEPFKVGIAFKNLANNDRSVDL